MFFVINVKSLSGQGGLLDVKKGIVYSNIRQQAAKEREKTMADFHKVLQYFSELSQIPRGSGNEKQVSDYLVQWGRDRGLESLQDEKNNVLIRRPAAPGGENRPGMIFQGHMDMVCEKTEESTHDFLTDPIELIVEDGVMRAKDTTLGADNGVGVAMGMALLEEEIPEAPMLELLVTTDEETGMSGAIALSHEWLRGKQLINVDSEEEGVLTAGSAGGITFFIDRELKKQNSKGQKAYRLNFSGLLGGHSGQNIHEPRGNMAILMLELLTRLSGSCTLQVQSMTAGTFDNVIPGSGTAEIQSDDLTEEIWNTCVGEWKTKHQDLLGELSVERAPVEAAPEVWEESLFRDLSMMLHTLPNGVHSMVPGMELVESSSNIALIHEREGKLHIEISLRSSNEDRLAEMRDEIASILDNCHMPYRIGAEYPSWIYTEESPLREKAEKLFLEIYGKPIETIVVHAGLECGCIYEKYPDMDMISIGPNIEGAHSPNERFELASGERVFDFLEKLVLAK